MGRGLINSQNKVGTAYLQKQVRQHDNLVLKQQNNQLTTENMKLKTKLMTLEKQNVRLQKLLQQDTQKMKSAPQIPGKQQRLFKVNTESNSMRMVIRNLKKELQDVKRENTKIKWSIKFTRINELQCQRDSIMEETVRLRSMIEQELGKRANIKIKQHGMSHLEGKINAMQERNTHLAKQNAQLHSKIKRMEQNGKKVQKFSQNQKNLNKMLYNARRVIKEKQKQIQEIKSSSNVPSTNSIPNSQKNTELLAKSTQETSLANSKKQIPTRKIPSKQKRIMSKSAQKYRANANKSDDQSENVRRLTDQNNVLLRKIQQLTQQLKSEKQKSSKKNLGELSKGPIQKPKPEVIETVGKFLIFRFKAHHLSLDEAEKYLTSSENLSANKDEEISVAEVVESLVAEPFSLLSSAYLQAFVAGLFYDDSKSKEITFDENKKLKKIQLAKKFRKVVKQYELMTQSKEEQMFIQIAELVTNYHQHILTALNGKRNGQGTISESDLTHFFNEIQLQKEYVDFIITQIILESYDLGHLNYYAMFEIFYMPTQQLAAGQNQQPTGGVGKKKFQVDYNNVVKQEDEEYEESRSYVDAKQKTQSRRQEQQHYDDQDHEGDSILSKKKVQSFTGNKNSAHDIANTSNLSNSNVKVKHNQSEIHETQQIGQEQINENVQQSNKKQEKKPQQKDESYEEIFEEEKGSQIIEEKSKIKKQQEKVNQDNKPYVLEEEVEDYQEEFDN